MNYNILIKPFINIIKDNFNHIISYNDANNIIKQSIILLNFNNKNLNKDDLKNILNYSTIYTTQYKATIS